MPKNHLILPKKITNRVRVQVKGPRGGEMWGDKWDDPTGEQGMKDAWTFRNHSSKKGQTREERKAQKEKREKERAQRWQKEFGREILKVRLRLMPITLFEKGFVQFGDRYEPQRLQGIQMSGDNLQKKSAAGRTAGAILTGGVNLIGSNQRGDIQLTIFTDKDVHSWPLESPYPAEVQEVSKLVATGQALIERIEAKSVDQGSGATSKEFNSVSEEIERLAALMEKGLLTRDEFDQAKANLLE